MAGVIEIDYNENQRYHDYRDTLYQMYAPDEIGRVTLPGSINDPVDENTNWHCVSRMVDQLPQDLGVEPEQDALIRDTAKENGVLVFIYTDCVDTHVVS